MVYNNSCVILLNELFINILTSVVFDFQHRFLTDVKTTNVIELNVNISFWKTNVNIQYITSIF